MNTSWQGTHTAQSLITNMHERSLNSFSLLMRLNLTAICLFDFVWKQEKRIERQLWRKCADNEACQFCIEKLGCRDVVKVFGY